MGEPGSNTGPLIREPALLFDRVEPGMSGSAAIVELRPPDRCKHSDDSVPIEVVVEPGSATRSVRGRSEDAGEWIERQLKSAPRLTDERWKRISNFVYRQTTSTRSGEKRPPLTAAGLMTAAESTD